MNTDPTIGRSNIRFGNPNLLGTRAISSDFSKPPVETSESFQFTGQANQLKFSFPAPFDQAPLTTTVVETPTKLAALPGQLCSPTQELKPNINSPLTQLDWNAQMVPTRNQHLETLVEFLKDPSAPPNAFFSDGEFGSSLNINEIGSSEQFSMRLSGAKAEDALVASGVALAKGVPSTYFAADNKQLPWFLQEADQTYPGLVSIFTGSPEQQAQKAEQHFASVQPSADARSLPHCPLGPQKVDTFLGCLMSGLTKDQYAEGRSHLQALNAGLSDKGRLDNYCEGIKVGSTAAFGTPKDSLAVDLEAVRNAKECLFYAYDGQSRPSGMWVELGAALAWEKPCKLLVPDKGCLPPSLQAGDLPSNLKIIEYGNHEQLLDKLKDPATSAEVLLP